MVVVVERGVEGEGAAGPPGTSFSFFSSPRHPRRALREALRRIIAR